MGTAAFTTNQVFTLDCVGYRVLRRLDANTMQLKEINTERVIERSIIELQRSYRNKSLLFHSSVGSHFNLKPPIRNATPEQLEIAKIRRTYVKAVLDHPSSASAIQPIIEQTWKTLKFPGKIPNSRTVLRWKAIYLKHERDIHALCPRDDFKGNRTRRYSIELDEFVSKAIDKIYLNNRRGTIRKTAEEVEQTIIIENAQRPSSLQLPIPAETYIKNCISAIPAYDRCVARDGYMAARKKFRSVLRHRITNLPLERAEIDHSLLDLFVIDETRGLPLGRPWLTICIDDNTRNILGVQIGFQAPSFITVAQCLRHAFLPKIDIRGCYPDIKGDWLAHGVMRELVMDQGREFYSAGLENACLSLGIEMHYAASRTPWYKGKIERVIGTLQNDLTHTISGTTFSNIFARGDYDPKKHATITLGTLRHAIYKWIIDVYHNTPHVGLGARPIDIWRSRTSIENIRVPEDLTYLDAALSRPIEGRRLSHKGVEHAGLLYNSPELVNLRRQLGDVLKVDIRVDDSDLGKIIVIAPDNTHRLIVVPAINREYAEGLTLWQHKIIRRYMLEYMNTVDRQELLNAKAELRALVEKEFSLKTGKGRVAAKKFLGEENDRKESDGDRKAASSSQQPEEKASFIDSITEDVDVKPFAPIFTNRSIDYL